MKKEELTMDHLKSFMAKNHPTSAVVEQLDDGYLIQTGSTLQKVHYQAILGHANFEGAMSEQKGNIQSGINSDGELKQNYTQELGLMGIGADIKSSADLNQDQRMKAAERGVNASQLDAMLQGRNRIQQDDADSQAVWKMNQKPTAREVGGVTPEHAQASRTVSINASHGIYAEKSSENVYGTGPVNAATVGKR